MTSQMTAFAIAVDGTSQACYLLMTRFQNHRANRSAPGGGLWPDGGNYTAAEGWTISSRLTSDSPCIRQLGQSKRCRGRR